MIQPVNGFQGPAGVMVHSRNPTEFAGCVFFIWSTLPLKNSDEKSEAQFRSPALSLSPKADYRAGNSSIHSFNDAGKFFTNHWMKSIYRLILTKKVDQDRGKL